MGGENYEKYKYIWNIQRHNLVNYKILFLAKRKPFAKEAAKIILRHFKKPDIIFGDTNDRFPQFVLNKRYHYIISYLSPWIVPKSVLNNTEIANINFHPGPPEYPGTGCFNFALYNNEKEYGITVHHMVERVDSGRIIMVYRFPIFPGDTVWSLSQRSYAYIYIAFINIIKLILDGKPLPESKEEWRRKPYTRKELNKLCEITKDMDEKEVNRRIRAVTYPDMPGAFIKLAGEKFIAESTIKAKEIETLSGGEDEI